MVSIFRKNSFLSKFLTVAFFLILFFYIVRSVDYNWEWKRALKLFSYYENGSIYAGVLLKGLVQTILISFFSLILSFILGFLSALLRISQYYSLRAISFVYVELLRNTPLIIQIFISYFIISNIFELDGYYAAIVALSLFEGAYISEIVRGSILSISKDQWDVSLALGMNKRQTLVNIILPQAVTIMLPSLGNIAVSIVKDSSLISIISVYELTFNAQKAVSENFLSFEVWFLVAFIYVFINIIIINLLKVFEKYMEVKG